MSNNSNFHFPLFVKGDVDGFIGLFVDNLINLLIITGLCNSLGMPPELVYGRILPGTALSVLAGNIFYSYQAKKLALKEKRLDVAALPYGINTVSLFAFFLLIIVALSASCGAGPQLKVGPTTDDFGGNDDGNPPGIATGILQGTYIKDGSNDIFASDYSVPVVYDWDRDGKKDLLLGYNNTEDEFGYIRFYRNQGSDSSPVFNGFTLVKACYNSCNLSVSASSVY